MDHRSDLRAHLGRDQALSSIGTVGDSFDNVLAETVAGYYKAELIRGPARQYRPEKTVEHVELATSGRVHWHNTEWLTTSDVAWWCGSPVTSHT